MADVDRLSARAHTIAEGPHVAVVKIATNDHPRVIPARDGAYMRSRFRLALGLTAD
jgi:hypothetical protein